MKFSYALLKQLIPKAPPLKKIAEEFNARSFEIEEFEGDMLDVKIYSNRYSDAASHLGIARETSAIFGLALKDPRASSKKLPKQKGLVKIKIEDKDACIRYSARVFDIPKVAESPAWMQKILRTCGINPINGIVDVMNYVMLEIGQPLHAFDAGKLANRNGVTQMSVRMAKKGEKLNTLDSQTIPLDPDMLVIADSEKPLALAGIKGGLESGVTTATTRIIVEAANFGSRGVFRTSRRLNLRTDAGVRFEHGLSPELVEWGMERATSMLTELGARLIDWDEAYPKKATDRIIGFDTETYENLIGAPVTPARAKTIFGKLGFVVESRGGKSAHSMKIKVPSWRPDLGDTEDLVEEVARIEGYNTFSPEAPMFAIAPAYPDDFVEIKDAVRDVLVAFGLDEVYNGTFLGPVDLEEGKGLMPLFQEWQAVKVANPLSEERSLLRPSLSHLLRRTVIDNGRFFEKIKCFEVGKVFAMQKGVIRERLALGIAIAAKRDAGVILEAKGIVEALLREFGVKDFSLEERQDVLHVSAGAKKLGTIVLALTGKHFIGAFAELDLEELIRLRQSQKVFKVLPRFPSVTRDLSLLIDASMRVGTLMEEIRKTNPKLLESFELVDEYSDSQLKSQGKRSLTFRFVFQALTHTLSEEDVNAQMKKITNTLAQMGVQVR